ncbi:Rieske (2Fe-2S) protein [Streptomyces sp. WMMC1477]|nr:Rieske (2Fe-2S) protein [Streptomyces sp. WMMC1477]MCZ7434714.1 Rieske (2Fe-2S) protein [Streptomyces sp. WMMC1477]
MAMRYTDVSGTRATRQEPSPSGPGRTMAALDAVERLSALDSTATRIRSWVKGLPLGRGRDALHGKWLGHPVHPLMVQVPVGSWLSAAALDLVPGQRRGAGVLVALGLAGAGPAAVAGWVDWAELRPGQQRVGLVHAACNIGAVGLYAGSLVMRLRGRHAKGRLLGFAGLSLISAGGALGGHLAYRQAVGANHAEGMAARIGSQWYELGRLEEFPVDVLVRRSVEAVPVVAVRRADERVYALVEQCSHLGGPLSQGHLTDGCVKCPWHGSLFRLSDGWNVHGPATSAQPAFETRVEDGVVHVRLRD